MSSLLHDLRLAWRMLVKNPGFTAVVVLTLALGIGLNTAVFAGVDALLLRPLPGVRAPNELVQVYRPTPGDMKYGSNSVPHFLDLRRRSTDAFSGAASWEFDAMSLSGNGRPLRTFGLMVSANFFSVLGVQPIMGRTFLPEEDVGRGAHPVTVVSATAWRTLFAGDPNIVGRQIVLNGRSYTIVGVAPREFRGVMPVVQPAFWVPLMQWDDMHPASARRSRSATGTR